MKFNYIQETELTQSVTHLKPGTADFEVKHAIETISNKKKVPMIKLTLTIWDCDGNKATLTDPLFATTPWKINHFAKSVNAPHLYNPSGEIHPQDCIGKTGKLKLERVKTERYGDSIKIVDYIMPEKTHTETSLEEEELPWE